MTNLVALRQTWLFFSCFGTSNLENSPTLGYPPLHPTKGKMAIGAKQLAVWWTQFGVDGSSLIRIAPIYSASPSWWMRSSVTKGIDVYVPAPPCFLSRVVSNITAFELDKWGSKGTHASATMKIISAGHGPWKPLVTIVIAAYTHRLQ